MVIYNRFPPFKFRPGQPVRVTMYHSRWFNDLGVVARVDYRNGKVIVRFPKFENNEVAFDPSFLLMDNCALVRRCMGLSDDKAA